MSSEARRHRTAVMVLAAALAGFGVVVTAVASLPSPSQAPEPTSGLLWIRQFGTSAVDAVSAIAVDASGVYLTGFTDGEFAGQTSAGGRDAFLRKYSADGYLEWTRQFGTSADDEAIAVIVKASEVYVVGETPGAFPNETSAGREDAFLRKYDIAGNEVWTRQFGTLGSDGARAVAADPSGVYVAGWANGIISGQTGAGSGFVRKYDTEGVEVWTHQFESASYGAVNDVAVDPSGLYVVGDGIVRKYDLAGNVLWTDQNDSGGRALAVDASGTYVAGSTYYGSTGLCCSRAFLRKYDETGFLVWDRQSPPIGESSNVDVTVGPSGVYVAGFVRSFTGSGLLQPVLRQYDVDGEEVWTLESLEFVGPVAVREAGVYVAGTKGEILPPGSEPSADEGDGMLAFLDLPSQPTQELEARIRSLEQELVAVRILGLVGAIGVIIVIAILIVTLWPPRPYGATPTLDGLEANGPSGDAPVLAPPPEPPSFERTVSPPTHRTAARRLSDRTIRLTTKERILLHLSQYARTTEAAEVPPALTLEGVAAAAWIEQRHVAQYVDPLVRDGLVGVRSAHVPNGNQRRRVYELTDAGRRVAARLLARAKSELVPVWDGEHIWEVQVGEIMEKVNHRLSVLDLARHLAEAGVVDFAALGMSGRDTFVEAGDSDSGAS